MTPQAAQRTFWVIGAVLVSCAMGARTYSHSVDMGLHYALARAIYDALGSVAVTERHLGVMLTYPPGAHWLAAAVSLLTGQPLISMHLLAVLAVYVTYACIAVLLMGNDHRRWLVRLVIMLSITYGLCLQQAAFGYHVIVNFFFPQLIGEAAVVATLCLLSSAMFAEMNGVSKALLITSLTWLLGYVQPLAAVQLGGTTIVFLFVETFLASHENKARWRMLLIAVAIALPVLMAASLHPAMRTMRAVSAHNGYLVFGDALVAGGFAWLLLFSVVVIAVALWRNRTAPSRSARVLCSACMAAVVLLAIQKVLLSKFALGSDYAVSKHVFFLVITAAGALAYAVVPDRRTAARTTTDATVLVAATPSLFAVLAVLMVFGSAGKWRQDLLPLLDYQRYARHFENFLLPMDAEGETVSLVRSLPPTFNLLVSFGDLKLPYNLAVTSISRSAVNIHTPVKFAIVSSGSLDSETLQECRVGGPVSARYTAVVRSCFISSLRYFRSGATVKTGSGGRGAEYLQDGWGTPEPWGTWSISDSARMQFEIAPDSRGSDYLLSIKYIPFIAGARKSQTFSVAVDGKALAREVAVDLTARYVKVPIHGAGTHTVDVHVESPASPRDLGLSRDDDRKLGVGILELALALQP